MRPSQLFLAFFLLCVSTHAQNVLTGSVVNEATGEPIGGASIRIEGTTRGTYTNGRGSFRLPLTESATQLRVRSIGYEERIVALGPSSSMEIALKPSSVGFSAVEVLGEITPEEVIKRASERVEENNKRIRSIISTLYTKMYVNVDGQIPGQDGADESITETFSKIYDQREPERKKRVHILQRRQTRNVDAGQNLNVFDQFFDFTTPEIRIFQTRLVTPLSPDALDEYAYTMLGKRPLGKLMVYELAFEPKARVYPGFEGRLTIVDGTYQVIEAKFRPTDETAFPFVRDITYHQRFERMEDTLWVPMYQEVTARGAVMVIAGLIDIDARFKAETFVTDVEVNTEIPDSVFMVPEDTVRRTTVSNTSGVRVRMRRGDQVTTVADDADSSKPEFWAAYAFTEQSDVEKEAYRRQDSIAEANPRPERDDQRVSVGMFSVGPVGISINPLIDRTAITGWMFGAELEFQVDRFDLTTGGLLGEYSTTAGHIDLAVGLIQERRMRLTANGSVFSSMMTIQTPREIFGRVNFLNLSNILYAYNHDYFRRDGFDVGLTFSIPDVRTTITYGEARHFNMPVRDAPSRPSIEADAGNYRTVSATVDLFRPSFFQSLFGGGSPVSGTIKAIYGVETEMKQPFVTINAQVQARLATFATGYNPMQLALMVEGGSYFGMTLPRQYQFSLLQRYPVFGSTTNPATVPLNAYGGTSYVHAHVEHNFTDIWWRAIGIPTFSNNRGVDLIAIYDVSRTLQGRTPVSDGVYEATGDWYMEAGVALARIPTFVSDLFYLRFDALWPVGPLAPQGSFGWSITVSSPLL
jgi:hypothetical protein